MHTAKSLKGIFAWSRVCIVRFTSIHEGGNLSEGSPMAQGSAVRDNRALSRFELDVEGATAFANYRLTPAAVIIVHTETPRPLRGRGIASELVKGALALIRADGLKVIAGCGFVVDYLQKHPEEADLVA
jgi:predicted GNAT family acetyltransferase